jgi:hypothetical protein
VPTDTQRGDAPAPARRTGAADLVLEAIGVTALCAFAWFVWPPSPLLVVGVYLVLGANLRAVQRAAQSDRQADA